MTAFRALLPFVLGVIAGSTDAIGFLGLDGLFTAHITGNLVVLASRVIAGDFAVLSHILAVPVFVVAALVAALFARRLEAKGSETLCPLLSLELTLLVAFLMLAVRYPTRFDPDSPLSVAVGMCGVSAMAVQSVVVKSALRGTPATVVMTTNITELVIALSRTLHTRTDVEKKTAGREIFQLLPVISGFLLGCAAGALGEGAWGLSALCIPALLALGAVGLSFAPATVG